MSKTSSEMNSLPNVICQMNSTVVRSVINLTLLVRRRRSVENLPLDTIDTHLVVSQREQKYGLVYLHKKPFKFPGCPDTYNVREEKSMKFRV